MSTSYFAEPTFFEYSKNLKPFKIGKSDVHVKEMCYLQFWLIVGNLGWNVWRIQLLDIWILVFLFSLKRSMLKLICHELDIFPERQT